MRIRGKQTGGWRSRRPDPDTADDVTVPRGRRRRDHRGAAMVEFALLLPVFAMLVFGAFSGAQAYNQKLTLVAAAREASRYGATLPIDATSTAADDCNLPKTMTTWLNCVEQS